MASPSVEGLRFLKFWDLDETTEWQFVLIDDLISFLRANKSENDSHKTIKKENIVRELQSHTNGIREENGKKYTTIASVYRYIFRNYDSFKICKTVADHIVSLTYLDKSESSGTITDTSTLQLYKNLVSSELFESLPVDQYRPSSLPTYTVSEYEKFQEFRDNNNWSKILLFEDQFQKYSGVTDKTSFDNILKKKWEFYNVCISMKKYGSICNKMASLVSQRNMKRKYAQEILNSITINSSGVVHRPEVIEKTITDYYKVYSNHDLSGNIAALGCTRQCDHIHGIHLYVSLNNEDLTALGDFATLAVSVVQKEHYLNVSEVVFLTSGVIMKTENGNIKRFELKDNMQTLIRNDKVLNVYKIKDQEKMDHPTDVLLNGNLCYQCFKNIEHFADDTLGIDDFNLLHEWYYNVPLPIQEYFTEAFICKQTLKKHEPEDTDFSKGKVSALFCVWEGLLNILSRFYAGVIQDLNTDELLVNYHNITTVFNVTSQTGISQSLRTGNRRLKQKADSDVCYYNTYLKAYPITYKKYGEEIACQHLVNLQNCHVVLMMDNLVHLSTKSDPLPGESRTTQVCTLPLTIKGVPLDSSYVSDWHHPTCDQSIDCECLIPNTLRKEDLDSILLSFTQEEQLASKKFKVHSDWGVMSLWKEVFELNRSDNVSVSTTDGSHSLVHLLDKSMESMKILDNDTAPADDARFNTPESSNHHFDTSLSYTENDNVEVLTSSESNIKELLDNIETLAAENTDTISDVTTVFGKRIPPPILTRHPPPASGKDDDIMVLKNVLDEMLVKINLQPGHKILFGPDFKIAQNVFKLMEQSTKYQTILPEFPVLHLRKSKITNLISAYKSSGLIHILQYMKDEETEKDWSKLLSIDNIEKATRNIWRLSTALQLAFLTKFYEHLSLPEKDKFLSSITPNVTADEMHLKWGSKYDDFIIKSCQSNATFCMHFEMKEHCNEIIAIAVAERLGGKDGYSLLLSSVKSSLRFSFLNGASSYAGFCVKLLIEHAKASHLHRIMKISLFSTPHNGSTVNFGLDTAREIDHRIAKKCIRPGSTLESILPKMCTVDDQQKVHITRKQLLLKPRIETEKDESDPENVQNHSEKYMGKTISLTDKSYIFRTSKLVLRQEGLKNTSDEIVKNVYHTSIQEIPKSVLDRETNEIGTYLITKYVAQSHLLGMTEEDIPNIEDISGPSILISRIKQAKGTTIVKSSVKPQQVKTVNEKAEEKRKKLVKKMSKEYDHLTSYMNTCQSIFKADGSKASTNKSLGVKNALMSLLSKCSLQNSDLILANFKRFPENIKRSTKKVIIEFAGAKFKMRSSTGEQYIQYINKGILNPLLIKLPHVDHVIICEEKYKFTPDDLKANTRQKRQKKENITISHLKEEREILSKSKMSKRAIISTTVGKSLISSYLAKNVELIDITSTLTLDIDSEAVMCTCSCVGEDICSCKPYCIPVQLQFEHGHLRKKVHLEDIHQRKGEAEMAMLDWIPTLRSELKEGDSIVSFVTSADIDTVVLHLFALSLHWERDSTGIFKWPVYVWLQKQKPELYNITGLIIAIENYLQMENAATKIALILSMGGNDFLPNFHGISHNKLMSLVLQETHLLQNLFKVESTLTGTDIKIDEDCYKELIKRLYCPPNLDHTELSIEHVRQNSIKPPNKEFRNPQLWMPPVSALSHLCKLIQSQIEYFLTSWKHSAKLPDFMSYGCFTKTDSGELIYNMGPEMHTDDRQNLLHISDDDLKTAINRAKIVRRKTSKAKITTAKQRNTETENELEDNESIEDEILYLEDIEELDDNFDDLPIVDMSLDDNDIINRMSDMSFEEDVPDGTFRGNDKRPLDETPGKKQQSAKRYPRFSTPKNRKFRRALDLEPGPE